MSKAGLTASLLLLLLVSLPALELSLLLGSWRLVTAARAAMIGEEEEEWEGFRREERE